MLPPVSDEKYKSRHISLVGLAIDHQSEDLLYRKNMSNKLYRKKKTLDPGFSPKRKNQLGLLLNSVWKQHRHERLKRMLQPLPYSHPYIASELTRPRRLLWKSNLSPPRFPTENPSVWQFDKDVAMTLALELNYGRLRVLKMQSLGGVAAEPRGGGGGGPRRL
jgi:hypothetical protein